MRICPGGGNLILKSIPLPSTPLTVTTVGPLGVLAGTVIVIEVSLHAVTAASQTASAAILSGRDR